MKQIVSLHIGQAGVQIGNACWQLFCEQHNISCEGKIKDSQIQNPSKVIFNENRQGNFTSRSIFIDTQSSVIDQVRTGINKNIHNPSNLISGKQDASQLYSRGQRFFRQSKSDILDQIRKNVELCQHFQGFQLFNSINGGTGSAQSIHIFQQLNNLFAKTHKISFTVVPSPQVSNSTVEIYNSSLCIPRKIEYFDAAIFFDNQALYKILRNKLDMDSPSYRDINKLIAQTSSSLLTGIQSDSTLCSNLNGIISNLVPYPRIHFLQSSLSPFINIDSSQYTNSSLRKITNQLYQTNNTMLSSDIRKGKFISSTVMYRGDVIAKDVTSAINNLKASKNISFVDWSPCSFKITINKKKMKSFFDSNLSHTMRSACAIMNSTSIKSTFQDMISKFDKLYNKRAFVHWYVAQGSLQQSQFTLSRTQMTALIKDIQESSNQTREGGDISSDNDQY